LEDSLKQGGERPQGGENYAQKKGAAKATPFIYRVNALPFVVSFVGYSQTTTASCTTSRQDATAVGRCHALTESVFVLSFPVGGLERAFHGAYMFYVIGRQR
jgi:hypothetical protein